MSEQHCQLKHGICFMFDHYFYLTNKGLIGIFTNLNLNYFELKKKKREECNRPFKNVIDVKKCNGPSKNVTVF